MTAQDKNLDREGGEYGEYAQWCVETGRRQMSRVSSDACALASPTTTPQVAQPQAGAAVPSDRQVSDIRDAAAILEREGYRMHAMALRQIAAGATPAPTNTGAAGAGEAAGLSVAHREVTDRLGQFAAENTSLRMENADLRAQLVLKRQVVEYEQRHAVESEKALAQVQAQLAQLKAPVGESIGNDERFNTLLLRMVRSGKAGKERADLIAHITAWKDAQLARQRQGGEPIYQSQYSDKHPEVWVDCDKRQYDLYVEHGLGKIPVRILYTTPPAAQAVPGDEMRDAKRWRILVEQAESDSEAGFQLDKRSFLRLGADNKGMLAAAADRAIALRATNTEGKEQQ